MNDHSQFITVIDDLSPEDAAMLQALYSRSSESVLTHLNKVRAAGSGKFMSSFYVGYGHKSIADCGSTTAFLENVSLLAAKAIQDWPLYCGQETSTRYIDMSKRDIIDPVNTEESRMIINAWMRFYTDCQERVAATVKERHPIREGEDPKTYEKAVGARVFDVLRGFLPAGVTTQLSWHTNLRQAGDHLLWLRHHPSKEISSLGENLRGLLHEKYPSSGFSTNTASVSGVAVGSSEVQDQRVAWEKLVAERYSYQHPSPHPMPMNKDEVFFSTTVDLSHETIGFKQFGEILNTRPKGCALPHFLSDLGQCTFSFYLDFGSYRDIQRHRNGVCRMPLLTTEYDFEPWYLEQLDDELRSTAEKLIDIQAARIKHATKDPVARQYLTALGFRVPTVVTYALPATVYVLDLRSGKAIHPSLRKKILRMSWAFRKDPRTQIVRLHIDEDSSDWDVRRGKQTITAK